MFTNKLNIGLLGIEKTVHEVKHTDSPIKQKFWVQQLVKVMLTLFWNMKGSLTMDFLEKDATLSSAFDLKIHLIY